VNPLTVALWVVTHWPGARVFPVVGKQPAFRELGKTPWSEAASADPDQIAAWFAGTDYGVAVTGVLAIDCDTDDEGATAYRVFGDALRQAAVWAGHPLHRTFVFAQPEVPIGDGVWEGGEIKGSGYVVLPPSKHVSDKCPECVTHPGHRYEWISPDGLSTPLRVWPGEAAPGSAKPQDPEDRDESAVTDGRVEGWLTPGSPCPALERVVSTLREGVVRPGASRHPLVMSAQFQTLRLGEQGHHGAREALGLVRQAFDWAVSGDPSRARAARSEWQRGLDGAIATIAADPTDWLDQGCCGGAVTATGEGGLEEAVFGATPLLERLRARARASRVGPWAMLGAAMAIVVGETHPAFTLPAVIGGAGTPNLFVALVGESGAGKSAAWTAASQWVKVDDPQAVRLGHATGEGLIAAYMHPNPDKDGAKTLPYVMRAFPAVVAFVDEIGQLVAANGRNGSTGDAVLRAMWSGAEVGTHTAELERRRYLRAGTYRIGLVVGAQPSVASHLLSKDAEATGMAQRWLWMPVSDPDAPDVPPEPGPDLAWRRPRGAGLSQRVTFPEAVLEAVGRERLAVLRGEVAASLDDHSTYQRMKVAAALALLHGTTDVSQETWELAGLVLRVSNATRDAVGHHLRRDAEGRVKAEGRRQAAKDEAAEEVRVERCMDRVLTILRTHADTHPDGCARRCLRNGMSNLQREVEGLAVQRLVAAKTITEQIGPDGALRWRRST
jgi:hypothetical protein